MGKRFLGFLLQYSIFRNTQQNTDNGGGGYVLGSENAYFYGDAASDFFKGLQKAYNDADDNGNWLFMGERIRMANLAIGNRMILLQANQL
jgi:hypothetical protein